MVMRTTGISGINRLCRWNALNILKIWITETNNNFAIFKLAIICTFHLSKMDVIRVFQRNIPQYEVLGHFDIIGKIDYDMIKERAACENLFRTQFCRS